MPDNTKLKNYAVIHDEHIIALVTVTDVQQAYETISVALEVELSVVKHFRFEEVSYVPVFTPLPDPIQTKDSVHRYNYLMMECRRTLGKILQTREQTTPEEQL